MLPAARRERPAHDSPAHEGVAASTEGDRIAAVLCRDGPRRRPACIRFEPQHRDRRHRARRSAAALRRRARRRRGDHRADRRAAGAAAAAPSRIACRASPTRLPASAATTASGTSSSARRSTSTTARRSPTACSIEVHGGEIYGEESGWLDVPAVRHPAGHQGRACGPTVACSTATASTAASPTTSPCSTGPATTTAIAASSTAARSPRRGAAGRQARQPRLPALAADRGAAEGDRLGAPSCACAPTSWARPMACRSIPTSASRAASRRVKTIVEQEVSARASAGPRGRALRRFGRRRLVSDRHPPLGPRRRRRELPHEAVPDSARCAAADPRHAT